MAAMQEGDLVGATVAGRQILITMVYGQYYAFEAHCSHAKQSLATGRLKDYEISCPLHGAKFDIRTGACTKAPADKPIQTFSVLLEGGKVCVVL